MKILLAHSRYRSAAPSGENRVVDTESAALTAAGHQVLHFERHSDDIAGWSPWRKARLPLDSIDNRQVRAQLAALLAAERPDVVHVHNTFPMLSASVLRAAADASVPVVLTVHNYKLLCASGDFFRDGSPCHDCADGRIGPALAHGCYRGSRVATAPVAASLLINRSAWRSLVSAYLFISASQRDLMAGLDLPPERVFVKHNLIHELPAATADPEPVVAYLGRLDAAKGIPLLMRAWDRFRELEPAAGLRLVIAGGGPLADELARWAAGRPEVEPLGIVEREEAAALLQRARAVVVPSAWEETFGLVAVEAMAAGTAPIATRHGSFRELVQDGLDGVLVEPGDPDALATAFQQAWQRPQWFAELGARAAQAHTERFDPDANLRQLVRAYEFAVANPVTPRGG